MRRPRRIRFAWWPFFVLLLVLPGYAFAQVPTALVVRARDVEPELREAVEREARAWLRDHGRTVIELPASPPAQDLRPALADAVSAYHDLRPEVAAPALDAVVAAFETTGEGLSADDLLDAHLFRSLTASALGTADRADAAIDAALVVDAALEVDLARFPPSLAQRVEARRGRVHFASLHLRSVPDEARVSIDGRVVAIDPAGLTLAVGAHVVRVEAMGAVPYVRQVALAAEGLSLDVVLEADPAARLREPGTAGDAVEPLATSAVALGAELLLVDLSREGADLAIAVVDRAAHARWSSVVDAALTPRELAERALSGPPDEPAAAPAPAEPSPRVRRRRLVAGIVSAVTVVGAGLAAARVISARGQFEGSFVRAPR